MRKLPILLLVGLGATFLAAVDRRRPAVRIAGRT